jgi:adenylate cyclase
MADNTTGISSSAPQHSDLSPEDIRAELERILGHRDFEATERTRDFLRFVVEETLAGRAHRLKGYTIAIEVFGRGKDFDANLDPIVRIQAGRLRRALEHYYLVAGGDDPIRVDVPKGGYVPTFSPQQPTPEPSFGKTDGEGADITAASPTIAILPLTNVTLEPNRSFFVDGLVEELISELNRYDEVISIPCREHGSAGEGPGRLRELSREVGARFVLGGSVRRDASHWKVSVHLLDAVNGHQIWGETYKVELEAARLIATQEQIARSAISSIAGEYGVIAQRLSQESRSTSPAELSTYEALLRYHHYMLVMTASAGEQAFAALQQATEREPDYGPTWSALANVFAHAYILERSGIDAPLKHATRYALRGVALEPRSQLARTIMAYVYLLRDEMDRFHQEADAALALNPHSPNYVGTIGYLLVHAGDFERGAALLERAIAWNPCHPKWFHHALYAVQFQRGDYEEAWKEATRIGFRIGFWDSAIKAGVLGKLGRAAEAEESGKELLAVIPDFERRAREIVSRSMKSPDLVDDFLDGLRKAGLQID